MFRSSLIFPFVVVIIFTVVLADDPKPSPAAEITTEGTGQATVSTAQPPSGSPTPTTTESNKKDVKKENDLNRMQTTPRMIGYLGCSQAGDKIK
ncbi:unnamed protein product [Hermetia illucens]|uniref:Uncharacterized protein n=1 Tax=Hermetia illucens TaxID=343691 RepID=A0A7R8V0E4_HERIL|nr:unnamed protein product [Hermetia illucens]